MSNEIIDGAIFSSTGELGTSERQDGRLYHNAEKFYDDATDLEATFQSLVETSEQCEHISRVVFRGVLSDGAFEKLVYSPYAGDLEVALPLTEVGHRDWLVYLARNDADRHALRPVAAMVQQTRPEHYRLSPSNAETSQLTTYSAITEDLQKSLLDLWGKTFGWNETTISGLTARLMQEQDADPSERSAWFSALVSGSMVVSAAMGERLSLPARDDQELALVESTEWRTHEDYQGMGLVTQNLRCLNDQIRCDLKVDPLIYAECNFMSRSDRAGYGAGFRIPSRKYAAQIAVQNVIVNDGFEPVGLRDFTFMYLPIAASTGDTQ